MNEYVKKFILNLIRFDKINL